MWFSKEAASIPWREIAEHGGQTAVVPFLQPKVEIDEAGLYSICGFEALMRVPGHPEISIEDIVDGAEESGQISYVFEVMMQAICRQLGHLKDQYTPRIAVNVSATQLLDHSFVDRLCTIVDDHKISRAKIGIEITEKTPVITTPSSVKTLRSIRDEGFTIAIDDFGCGYSTLASIHDLPVNEIKLDRSFMLKTPERYISLMDFLVRFCRDSDIDFVVEGVENSAHHAILCDRGVTGAQGYYYGRPIPIGDALLLYIDHTNQEAVCE